MIKQLLLFTFFTASAFVSVSAQQSPNYATSEKKVLESNPPPNQLTSNWLTNVRTRVSTFGAFGGRAVSRLWASRTFHSSVHLTTGYTA